MRRYTLHTDPDTSAEMVSHDGTYIGFVNQHRDGTWSASRYFAGANQHRMTAGWHNSKSAAVQSLGTAISPVSA